MRTAKDVYDRLLWDGHLFCRAVKKDKIVIGFIDRALGKTPRCCDNDTNISEKPLSAWKTDVLDDDHIPWHRVIYFKCGQQEIIWHKLQKIDKVFNSV